MSPLTTETEARPEPPEVGGRVRLRGRLLAETVRALEQDGASPIDERPAEDAARDAGGGLEHRVVVRARTLSAAGGLAEALGDVRRATAWIVLAGMALAAVTGAGAARAAMGTPPEGAPVNFFWVFLGLLGFQTLLLAVWIVLMVTRPTGASVSPLGGATLALGRWLGARLHRDRGRDHLAAVRATALVFGGGATGRWTLSAVSHALWLAFNVGCVTLLVLLLAARHYTFRWETTILSAAAYERVTRVIAFVPEAIGFETPDAGQISSSGELAGPDDLEAARVAWSQLLVGSVVAYALVPRLLLCVVSLHRRRKLATRFRLDLAAPGYARLRERLMPAAEGQGIIGERPADEAVAPLEGGRGDRPEGESAPTGPPVIIGLEIERPPTAWPPRLHAVRWVDLGFVDSRDDRRRALGELHSLGEPPRLTAIACDLTITPDRGARAFIEEVVEVSGGPVALMLTGGERLRERGDANQVARRVEDWRRLAGDAGLAADRVLELDLDHVTDASLRRLADLVGVAAAPGSGDGERLAEAFAAIVRAVRRWNAAPDARTQAALHQEIAGVYRSEAASWRRRLGVGESFGRDAVGELSRGAERIVHQLPHRLRMNPRWLVAGAMTGALGCVGVTLMLSPAAIGALPIWSALGAAMAAVIPARRDPGNAGEEETTRSRAEAVRSAALFALLLELQGRDETMITRVLDRVLDENGDGDENATLADADTCGGWLDAIRRRYHDAVAAEVGR